MSHQKIKKQIDSLLRDMYKDGMIENYWVYKKNTFDEKGRALKPKERVIKMKKNLNLDLIGFFYKILILFLIIIT